MKYESSILKRLIDTYGVIGNPRYLSEIIKEFIVRGKELYPQLFTYQSDWLAHIDEFGLTPEYVVSYTGQQIYAPHTKERPVKRAILSGNTIKNLHKKFTTSGVVEIAEEVAKLTNSSHMLVCNTQEPLANNTQYLIKIEILNNTASRLSLSWRTSSLGHLGNITHNLDGVKGVHEIVATTPANGIIEAISFKNESSDGEISVTLKCVITPYQVGLSNIPFFDGLCSVKMPVLTTTGKNFMSSEMEIGNFNSNDGSLFDNVNWQRSSDFIVLKSNTQYQLNDTKHGKWFLFYDKDRNFINSTFARNGQFTTPYNCAFVKFSVETNDLSYKWQIELGNTITDYEPHKTNILTVNEEVELRGIGDVKDELDCLTGELTQRITSKTLRGGDDEDWRLFNNTIIEKTETVDFLLPNNIEQQKNSILKCDTIKEQNIKSSYQLDEEGISCKGGNGVSIWLSLSKTKATNVAELKTYLQSNPITLQYQLAIESIKTVDLTIHDKDQQKVERLTSFEGGTHFTTSSQEGSLLPTITVDVVTDLEETLNLCSMDGNTL